MDAQFLIELETLAAALDQLDYFAVLKLPQTATPAEIKAAYYRESRTSTRTATRPCPAPS
jgi:hypothetical protein